MGSTSAGKWILGVLLGVAFMVAADGLAQGAGSSYRFATEELDQMLAPVALYPDSLLAQILMAATYPVEVVEADRWSKCNKNLKGAQVKAALDQRHWDLSVKALIPFPQVLAMMSQKLDWTQRVGDALLAQKDEVMDTIQHLRSKAFAQGNLKSSKVQKVVVEQQVIRVEPADPRVIPVPVYNPTVVYGAWWYPSYPPYSCSPAGKVGAAEVKVGSAWNSAWGTWDWGGYQINTNINRNLNLNQDSINLDNIQTSRWQHDAQHRKGNPYRSRDLRERYGHAQPGDPTRRESFRGFEQRHSADLNQHQAIQAQQRSDDDGGRERQALAWRRLSSQPDPLALEERGSLNAFQGVGRGDDIQRFSDRGRRSRRHAGPINAGGEPFRGRET